MSVKKYHYYRLSDGVELTEDEATDENGCMRSGVKMSVPWYMRDSNNNVLTDAFGEPLNPTFNRRGYVFTDNSNRSPPSDDDHPDVRKFALSKAWEGGQIEPGDAFVYEGTPMVATHHTDDSHIEFVDIRSLDGDKLKQDAYQQYKAHLSGAWKRQKEPSPREWEISGPLSDSKNAEVSREQAWLDSVEELSNAWRK